ncbi:single-stranded-DNA-specific exonuclease [Allopseudospirillum japonicum]|uniref:Single-stranded-DNA-specific exonuclease RecJ n=1 Tax=Allopseudospirillum japonicum TaxID=64971 RepID=A0A1H6TPL2_9GAMM|nr:DHH family phosphoesterase [Allopseudospirillum japonicum]SEI78145.1 single-stranded-DNA-specific exonuclease [Allopseudospirillum japonicum]
MKTKRERPFNAALAERLQALGLTPLQARIFCGRLLTQSALESKTPEFSAEVLAALVQPQLQHLAHPDLLKDMPKAVQRLQEAIQAQQKIGILTDYDVDGISSHLVIYRALHEYFGLASPLLASYIGHRLEDGYGISANLVDRILAETPLPKVIISADCGSSDETQIQRLAAAGIDVIVTDHHALPIEGPPPSAYAVINPTRHDCPYPDASIAGCMVAWLFMSALRTHLIRQGQLSAQAPKLSQLLTYVALGTVADCVTLGQSAINRAVVTWGLKLINQDPAPCWQAMRERLKIQTFDAQTLAFQMGPRINARSRLADPYAALYFMQASDLGSARTYLEQLDQDNQARKQIESQMTQVAKQAAQPYLQAGCQSLVLLLEQGHPGVQGIVASRLVQAYGVPTLILTPGLQENTYALSGRSVLEVHLREALQGVADLHPDLFIRFGGHRGAAGASLVRQDLTRLRQAFEACVRAQLDTHTLSPYILVDDNLNAAQLTLATVAELQALEPYGREFETPLFYGHFYLDSWRLVGAEGQHISMRLVPLDAPEHSGIASIWFYAVDMINTDDLTPDVCLEVIYTLNANTYRGRTHLQLVVESAHCIEHPNASSSLTYTYQP